MKICFVGTGYVGLISGTCFADLGNSVICVDNNEEKISCLRKGDVPFFEPGLSEKIIKNINSNRLTFSNDLNQSVIDSDFIFIAVGTPDKKDGSADLSSIYNVLNTIITSLKTHKFDKQKLLITKSTVPVGTGKKISTLFENNGIPSSKIAVLSNPEFLREGSAIYDFFTPERIVIGGEDRAAIQRLKVQYETNLLHECPIITTNLETSELSKYTSNTFLATKISFINEVSNLCEKTGADIQSISKIMGLDKRIGKLFLQPGPGYGGSCFPKDVKALISVANDNDVSMDIAKATQSINTKQKTIHLKHLYAYYENNLKNKTIGILGISFKPNTDDIREAPSLEIIKELLQNRCKIKVFDPEALSNLKKVFQEHESNITYCKTLDAVATDTDALILTTEWNMFRELDLHRIHKLMRVPLFIDLRLVYTTKTLTAHGFDCFCIGEPPIFNRNY
ncbi:UDP-glucose/GDP-mannose dehydrogenase family protein [bacterium]|jgi:UDPglucose 6-dehydrogenase|nr:UDP-glucose/GDP-mannose dehydrogenase family protein [bacterium]